MTLDRQAANSTRNTAFATGEGVADEAMGSISNFDFVS